MKRATVDVRNAVIMFSHVMTDVLLDDRNKDKDHWSKTPITELHALLMVEAFELSHAIITGNELRIVKECADVANFAMMIADNIRTME